MSLEGELTRLRALEAEDVDLLYVWENDPAVWGVSGTLAPFSRHTLRRFLDEQRFDLYAARQLAAGRRDTRRPRRGTGRPLRVRTRRPARRRRHPDPRRPATVDADSRRMRWTCSAAMHSRCSACINCGAAWRPTTPPASPSSAVRDSSSAGRKREWRRTPDGWADELLLQKIF